MKQIDPIVIPIPQQFADDPVAEAYFRYLHGVIQDLITAIKELQDAVEAL